MKSYNTILIENQPNYLLYHQVKFANMNKQQIIEQAKFRYSFEKQIKTFEDQGEKQIKAIQDQRHVKTIKKYDYDDEDSLLISKQKEIFNDFADEILKEITELERGY